MMTETIDAITNVNGTDQQQFAQALAALTRCEGVYCSGRVFSRTG